MQSAPPKTDKDLLREHHRFIRTERDDESSSYGNLIAIQHYSRLYKDYCICDLTYYSRGKVGLRWCTESDILALKGINICCEQHCNNEGTLYSHEV
jgi:Folate-sensitive fragile site protein Fra10Ac1